MTGTQNFTVTVEHFEPLRLPVAFSTGTVSPPGDIIVSGGSQQLNFTIAPDAYVPVGCYYRDESTGAILPADNPEFSAPAINGQTLSVTDVHDNLDTYEMYIAIRRVSDNVFGVFDPKIRNQP